MRFFLFCVFLSSSLALSRVVDNVQDEIRLNGFYEQRAEDQKLDQNRRDGLLQLKKDEALDDKKRHEALSEYVSQKAAQKKIVDDSGPDYKEDLKERIEFLKQHEKNREAFVEKRNKVRLNMTIHLSEEEEYGINDNTPRTDWKRRKWAKGLLSSDRIFDSGSSYPNSSYPNSSYPSFPPPNNVDYQQDSQFQSMPPPPPLMNFESNFGDDSSGPPPPPPIFDEDVPF